MAVLSVLCRGLSKHNSLKLLTLGHRNAGNALFRAGGGILLPHSHQDRRKDAIYCHKSRVLFALLQSQKNNLNLN